ncbi:MAG TPA: VOC family protein [Rugosimonospora sp.]|nr:VOC family protein [Rugosimonospora sp.]
MSAFRFDHVGINVRDLDAAAGWYAAAFGLSREFEVTLDAFALSIVMLRSPDGYRIELLHRPGSEPGLRAADPPAAVLTEGYGHVALAVADLDAGYARLLELGAGPVMAPRPSPEPGVRMAFVRDPEGNLVELVERG